MKKLFARWFPDAYTLAELGKLNDELRKERDDLKDKNTALWDSYNKANSGKLESDTKLAQATTKLREQNEADLMVISLRIVGTVLRGKKPLPSDLAQQQNFLAQQQGISPYSLAGQAGNFLGGLFPCR